MEVPTDRPASAPVAAAARRVVLGFGVREIGIGVIGLAILAAGGAWLHRRFNHNDADVAALRQQIAIRVDAAEVYRDRIAALKWNVSQMRTWADSQVAEPGRTWARERARRFDAFVAQLDRAANTVDFTARRNEIEQKCAQGDVNGAKAQLANLPMLAFPGPAEFARLRREWYEAPLAQFSRQNPDYYRAFRQNEPDAAKADETQLRSEITQAKGDAVTPQQMLKVDLLAAVAGPEDPVVAEWAALASAVDYFENPDAATIDHWRAAQKALKTQDWQTATNEMQAIALSKVRTRQLFRAAFGRVLIKSRPDQPGDAYPYMFEAAATGDKQARAWVAQQDYNAKRYDQAKHWIEAGVADGDNASLPLLLELYEKHADETAHDPAREAQLLERVTDRPDSPADAALLLGRMYERGDPPGSTKGKALACYRKAAAKGSPVGNAEVARCALRGIGAPEDLDQARDAACRAFAAGERERSTPILLELMRRSPERAANAIQHLFEREDTSGPVPYTESTTVDGPGVAQLKAQLAAYFDRIGKYNAAARFYAGARDPVAAQRHVELTTMHACETCGGIGKVQTSIPCPTCSGSGKQICSFCSGTGFTYAPGTPPCPTCSGAGTVVQDRKVVTCATCGGSGKGKGGVIKKDCTHCEHGYIRCSQCTDGVIKVMKDCPDCHGRGKWSLTERGE